MSNSLKKEIRIGLLGLGTVGGGVLSILRTRTAELEQLTGRSLVITAAAVNDVSRQRPFDVSGIRLTTDPLAVVEADDVDVVLELMGGTTDAFDAILKALSLGKPVVTANKAVLAERGAALFAASAENQAALKFEASIAGGIPIVKALTEGLAANRVDRILGIINGTGNFILTQMEREGMDFATALSMAQELGYAEADPTFDVEGYDAAHKLTILASLGFNLPLTYKAVYTEGIGIVESSDLALADELGYRIKHLGMASRTESGYVLRVHPTLIPKSSVLAQVDGVLNAVQVDGDSAGPTLYCGAGAGAGATASAVVADLIDIVRCDDCLPPWPTALSEDAGDAAPAIDQLSSLYYLRMQVEDRPGVIKSISTVLADLGISIEAMLQKDPGEQVDVASIVILTHETTEANINQAMAALDALSELSGKTQRIRVESL